MQSSRRPWLYRLSDLLALISVMGICGFRRWLLARVRRCRMRREQRQKRRLGLALMSVPESAWPRLLQMLEHNEVEASRRYSEVAVIHDILSSKEEYGDRNREPGDRP